MSVQYNPFGVIALALPDLPNETKSTATSEQSYLQDVSFALHKTASQKRTFYSNELVFESSPSFNLVSQQRFAIPSSYVFAGFGEFLTLGNFAAIALEIENLSLENEIPPTSFAYLKCHAVVGAAYGLMGSGRNVISSISSIPRPIIVTDDLGGIRLAWRKGDKTVRANFGATGDHQSYAYFESDTEHGVTSLDGASLSDRLTWLVKR